MIILRRLGTCLALALFGLSLGNADDKLIMKSGRVYEGRIIGESETEVTLMRDGITIGYSLSLIERIEKEAVEAAPNVMPDAEKMLAAALAVAPEEWVQIPATVIDDGILRNVPYVSYRAGKLELNIYGDPAAPAGVEIGIYGTNTSTPFKQRLVAFVAEVTTAEFTESFNLDEDKKRLGSIDYEITPPTAPDAYGAWWISAYDLTRLEAARFSDTELNEITVKRAEVARVTAEQAERDAQQRLVAAWSAADLARAIRPSVDTAPQYARPTSNTSESSYSSGRVFVRGYYRKDGTYVRPHTRSR